MHLQAQGAPRSAGSQLEAGRSKEGAFRGNMALQISWFLTSELYSYERMNFCCFKTPSLLWKSQESNSVSTLTYVSFHTSCLSTPTHIPGYTHVWFALKFSLGHSICSHFSISLQPQPCLLKAETLNVISKVISDILDLCELKECVIIELPPHLTSIITSVILSKLGCSQLRLRA